VFLDDVQFDLRGWRNRNRIRGPNGTFWLTIPVKSHHLRSSGTRIRQVEIDWSRAWNKKHLKSLQASYSKAPFFSRYSNLLHRFYSRKDRQLSEFVIEFNIALAGELGILDTDFLMSSSLGEQGEKTERLVRIVQRVGADTYLTGPAAKNYLDESQFANAGIRLEYAEYGYPDYPQLYPGFVGQVSILDLLFMTGTSAPSYIWER